MTRTIVTRAPTRIDFGGGWTDVPPYATEMGGYVCNVAIARYASVTLTLDGERADDGAAHDPDQSIAHAAAVRFRLPNARVSIRSDFPIGAGLGGSSAVGVATVAAMAAACDIRMPPADMAELSREIEISDLAVPGGRQDHYAAACGGALGLRFSAAGVQVQQIPLSDAMRDELARRCIIIYTGQSRVSGDTIRAVMGAYRARDRTVMEALHRMRALAEEMAVALQRGELDALAELVDQQWTHQRSLHPAIPTPTIDAILTRGKAAGALGGKALGASGGGCVLLMARADRVDAVRDAARALGEVLPFTVAAHGVEQCP